MENNKEYVLLKYPDAFAELAFAGMYNIYAKGKAVIGFYKGEEAAWKDAADKIREQEKANQMEPQPKKLIPFEVNTWRKGAKLFLKDGIPVTDYHHFDNAEFANGAATINNKLKIYRDGKLYTGEGQHDQDLYMQVEEKVYYKVYYLIGNNGCTFNSIEAALKYSLKYLLSEALFIFKITEVEGEKTKYEIVHTY